jgi:Rhs element Vgr protein
MGNFKVKLAGEDITAHFADFQLEQRVGRHHAFTLRIGSEDRASHFRGSLADACKKWIGKPLEVDGFFKGVVTSVGLSRAPTGGSDFIVRGHCPTILADDGPNTRSFGEKTLKKIFDEVMGPYESKLGEVKANPRYTSRIKYCVQHRESNYGFLNRLAARYGEWFFYDGQKLYFGKPSGGSKIQLNFERDLTRFDLELKTVPVNFKLMAYDYKNHDYPEKETQYAKPANEYAQIALDKSQNEVFPKKTTQPLCLSMSKDDVDQMTTLRQDARVSEMVFVSGASTNEDLRLGSIVEVVDPRSNLEGNGSENYGKYVITYLFHSFQTNGEQYTNHFEGVPSEAAVPPVEAPSFSPGSEMQPAEVIDNDDPKGMGRVRVQFEWQRSANGDDGKTCWIRVAAPMGGGDKGFYMIPEKGDQVLVAFEDGNPERPFVLMPGMYHGKAKPEHYDSQNNVKVLKTRGGNQIIMNDEQGQESMAVSSPADVAVEATGGRMEIAAKKTIIIQSSSGDITIEGPAKLTVHAADIVLKGDSSIKLEAPTIDIQADGDLAAKAAHVAIEAQAAADFTGDGMVNISSKGITSVAGSFIKLN